MKTRAAAVSLACLAACVTGLVTGCAGESKPSSIEQRRAASPLDYADYSALGYQLSWRGFPYLSSGSSEVLFVVPMGEVVGVLESGSVLSLLDDANGRLRSSPGLASSLRTFLGMTLDGKRVLVASDTELLFVDAQTGMILDRQKCPELANTDVLVTGNSGLYGTSSGEALVQNLVAGVKLQGRKVNGPIDYAPVGADTPSGRVAFVASRTGDAMVMDARRGDLYGRVRMFKGPGSQPASGGGMFYVASNDQSLYAFDARTASQRWRIRTEAPVTGAPVYHDGTLYCELPGEGLVAVNASNGSRRWVSGEVHGAVIGLRGGRLIAWDPAAREAVTLDPSTGGVRDRVELPSIARIFCEPFLDGSLYTVSDAAVVAKFTPNN